MQGYGSEVSQAQIDAELAAYADLLTSEGNRDPWEFSVFENPPSLPWADSEVF